MDTDALGLTRYRSYAEIKRDFRWEIPARYRIGGGLDGPLRGLPREELAPAKPARERGKVVSAGGCVGT